MVTEVETWSVRVSGWNAEDRRARWRRWPRSSPCPTPPSTARRFWCRSRHRLEKIKTAPDRGRRVGALLGPRRQPRNAIYRAPRTGRQIL
jgi:hypothetical protein